MNLLREVGEEAADKLTAALNAHAIVAVTDSQGKIIFANERFCETSGFSKEELVGQDLRMINPSQPPSAFLQELRETVHSGNMWSGEIKNRAKNGSFYWVTTTIVPILDKQGNLRQFAAVGADVTDRKRIEVELADRLRLQKLLAQLSSRFDGLNSEHVDAVIEASQGLVVETLGLDQSGLWQVVEGSENEGMTLTHGWQRPGRNPIQKQFFTANNVPWTYACVMSGETLSFSNVAELPPNAAKDRVVFLELGIKSSYIVPLALKGSVFGALQFSALHSEREWKEDEITEVKLVAQIIGNVLGRQQAELREEQLRAELAHAMRITSMGEIASALAHELNQPLAAILSNAQAARRFLADGAIDELRVILDDIVRDDKRASSVIHNLRGMVSKQPATREVCNVNDLVSEVLDLLKAQLIGERILVNSSLQPGLSPVKVARVELQQVLVNLLINAMHAMEGSPRENRRIEIRTFSDAGEVSVEVRDQGSGIPPERLESIFDPFFSTKTTGLGMGLSICRRIIKNHGGRLEVRNHEEGGVSFTFFLAGIES